MPDHDKYATTAVSPAIEPVVSHVIWMLVHGKYHAPTHALDLQEGVAFATACLLDADCPTRLKPLLLKWIDAAARLNTDLDNHYLDD